MLYPEAKATYRFTNRAKGMRFNSEAFEYIKKAIKDMDQMRLTPEEKKWLRRTCPYFPADYLDWLLDFQLDSDKQVRIIFNKDDDSEFGELDIASMLGACQKQGSPLIAIPFPQSKGSGLR
jgi:nicotinate phosphoribosyltransferase